MRPHVFQPRTRACKRCGAIFVVVHARHKHQVFCSVLCSARSRPTSDPAARFWVNVSIAGPDDCWPWNATRQWSGYGRFYFNGRLDGSHRVAWILTHGPVHDGLFVLHRCDNPPCCNPNHLLVGSSADNSRDMTIRLRHGSMKLSPTQVIEIRQRAATGETHRALARIFGVTKSTVSYAVNRHTWSHIC